MISVENDPNEIAKIEKAISSNVEMCARTYSTAFYVVGENGFFCLMGSGTFVNLNGKKHILTASHVADELEKHNDIGITISGNGRYFRLETKYLCFKKWKSDRYESNSPDLAAIELPGGKVAEIEARGKSFYNLDSRITQKDYGGMWAINGWPEESAKYKTIDELKSTIGLCRIALTINPRFQNCDGYNLAIFKLRGGRDELGLSSYGGISGAGCWNFTVQEQKGVYSAVDITLEAVVFYQLEDLGNIREVVAHNINSASFLR